MFAEHERTFEHRTKMICLGAFFRRDPFLMDKFKLTEPD